jgi:hypothetical protein
MSVNKRNALNSKVGLPAVARSVRSSFAIVAEARMATADSLRLSLRCMRRLERVTRLELATSSLARR